MALLLNAGAVAFGTGYQVAQICYATIFVSHSWSEIFQDFVTTLQRNFDDSTVVWVCSLAIYQHGDVSGSLADLNACPFSVAMRATSRVLVVTDSSGEALQRCWVSQVNVCALTLGSCMPSQLVYSQQLVLFSLCLSVRTRPSSVLRRYLCWQNVFLSWSSGDEHVKVRSGVVPPSHLPGIPPCLTLCSSVGLSPSSGIEVVLQFW